MSWFFFWRCSSYPASPCSSSRKPSPTPPSISACLIFVPARRRRRGPIPHGGIFESCSYHRGIARSIAWPVARLVCADNGKPACGAPGRSEEQTSELQSLMHISYAVFCLKKKKQEKKQ